VLSPALIPNKGTKELSDIWGIGFWVPDGFFLEAHHKLKKGVETKRKGIFVAGAALGPKDIRETTMEQWPRLPKLQLFWAKGKYQFLLKWLSGSWRCPISVEFALINVPPTPLIRARTESHHKTISSMVQHMHSTCPKEALDLRHTSEKQYCSNQRNRRGRGPTTKVIAFYAESDSLRISDLGGQNRTKLLPWDKNNQST